MIGLVLSCEHASWTLPPGVDLGVPLDVLRSQASWDHGALDIANQISDVVGIPVHAGAFSRMFVDLNRDPEHPDVIPRVSYGAPVPGNTGLAPADRAARLAAFHAPYWQAVRTDVTARLRDRGRVLHFCSHSFSPELDPVQRTYEVGVMYDTEHPFEAELSERLLFHLRRSGFDVRANQPYTGVGPAICTSFRKQLGADYAGIQFETSHKVTESPDGCTRVARALTEFLQSVVA